VYDVGAEVCLKGCGEKRLGRGFPRGSGEGEDRPRATLPSPSGKGPEGFEGIGDDNFPSPRPKALPHHHRGRPLLKGVGCKALAVLPLAASAVKARILPLEREEEIAGAEATGI
jgi:hypothetical protein